MRRGWTTGLLGTAVLAAACGGAVGPGPASAPPPPPAETASATPAPPPAPPASSTAAPATTSPVSPPAPELKAPVPSTLAPELLALGLDLNQLPPIARLEPKALRGVMKLFARSLGVKCGDCHREGDFAAPTRRKKIAAKMWDELVAKLAFASPDGAPLFCDSCHQGRVAQLDRRDKKALSRWMDENFVARLRHRDGGKQDCETCHVGMEMQFLALWAK